MAASVGLLGPVRLRIDGVDAPVRRLQVRQLLALLGSAESALTADELIEQLWPADLPANPRRALQVAMSRLRTTLGPAAGIVLGGSDGFSLEPGVSDVSQFIHASQRCQAGGVVAVPDLAATLALWRGAPFTDAAGPSRLEQTRRRLEEARRHISVALASAHLDERQAASAREVIRPRFDDDHTDERSALLLSRSLAMEGRRREALDVLTTLRAALRDQVGIDPSPAVDAAEQGLLQTVELTSHDTAAPTNDVADVFVGRDEEQSLLTAALEDRRSVALIGEPGIGKSTLLRRVAGTAADRGATVLTVTASANPTRPLAPIADLLTATVQRFGPPVLSVQRDAAARVVPELVDGPTVPGSREELVEHIADYVTTSTREHEAVLVLDDLHWIDSLSAAVVEELVGSGAISLLLGSRPSSAPHLARLIGGGTAATRLDLSPLDPHDISAYLEARYGAAPRTSTRTRVADRSGGHPLFLRLLVDLDLDGALSAETLPASVLVAVKERLDQLSSRAVGTIQTAAVMGDTFDETVLAAMRPWAAADLDEALDARLVHPGGTFAHPLVAQAAYEMLPDARRVELHDQVAEHLALHGAGPLERVHHAVAAAELDPVRACEMALAAGQTFAGGESLRTGRSWLERGVALAQEHGMTRTPLGIELELALGRTQRLLADPAHVVTLVEAGRLAEETDAHELFARCVVELSSHGGTTKAGRSDEETLTLIDRALAAPIPAGIRAELKASATTLTALSVHWERGQRLYREALAALDDIDDPAVHARVLTHIHLGLSHPEDYPLRRPAIDRLALVAAGDVDLLWEVAYLRFWEAFVAGNAPGTSTAMAEIRDRTPRARHRHLSLMHVETAWAHVRGDLDAAERSLDQSLELALEMFPESWAIAHYSGLLFAIRDSQGRLAELGDVVARFMEQMPEFGNWRGPAALISTEIGDIDAAARTLSEMIADDFAAVARDFTWWATLASLGRVAAAIGDEAAAARLYGEMARAEGTMAWAGSCAHGTVDRTLALLADTLGRTDDADRHRATDARITDAFARARP